MRPHFSFTPLLLFAIILLGTTSCPEEVDPRFPAPAPVRLVPVGSDADPVEKGLRSSAGNQSVIIEWIKPDNPETPIREYRIYKSFHLDSPFVAIGSVFSNEPAKFIDLSIKIDTMMYYMIRAVDTRGKISPTALYFHPDSLPKYIGQIIIKYPANPFRPFPTDTVTTKPRLTWCYPVMDLPAQYVIKIALPSTQVIWIAKIPNRIFTPGCDESGDKEFLTFNHQSYLVPNDSIMASASVVVIYSDPVWVTGPRLQKGSYLWRIEGQWGNPVYHSRSNWSIFNITKEFP